MRLFMCLMMLIFSLTADEKLREICVETVEKAESVKAVLKEDMLFPFQEIRHLSRKKSFSENCVKSIINYERQLKKEGIDLLVVPVPPKVLIYKELFVEDNTWNPYEDFHKELKKSGVNSLDLVPVFYEMKKITPVFCKTDSHFSPMSVNKITDAIIKAIKMPKGQEKFTKESADVIFSGDLSIQSEKKLPREKYQAEIIRKEGQFFESNPESPVILMGDSNCLIYSGGGDLHVRGAGLFEHLSMGLGQRIDLLGVKGSGIDQARIDFYRRSMDSNYLKKKKLVIWLFAAYELTESRGWKNIPVRR